MLQVLNCAFWTSSVSNSLRRGSWCQRSIWYFLGLTLVLVISLVWILRKGCPFNATHWVCFMSSWWACERQAAFVHPVCSVQFWWFDWQQSNSVSIGVTKNCSRYQPIQWCSFSDAGCWCLLCAVQLFVSRTIDSEQEFYEKELGERIPIDMRDLDNKKTLERIKVPLQ